MWFWADEIDEIKAAAEQERSKSLQTVRVRWLRATLLEQSDYLLIVFRSWTFFMSAPIEPLGPLCQSGSSTNEPIRSILTNSPTYVNTAEKEGNGIFRVCPPWGPISYATFYRPDLFMTFSHSHNLALTPCDTRTRCDLPIWNAFATGKINRVVAIVPSRALPPLSSPLFLFFFTSVSLSSFSAVTFPRPISADFWVLEEQMAPAHDLFKPLT